MIVRWLWLLILIAVWWVVRRALRRAPPRGGAPGGSRTGRPHAADGGEMVRDRVCNTYVPRTSAIALTLDGRTHYFCSDACRERFLVGQGGSSG